MFCRNCGNEMKENERFCSKCGTKAEIKAEETVIEEPVADIPAAEEPVAEPVAEAPAEVSDSIYIESFEEINAKPKKKKKFLKVILPLVLVLALALSGFAHPVTRNALMRTFMSNESYFAYVVENSAKDLAEAFVGTISEYRGLLDGKFEGASGSAEIELGNAVKDFVYEVADYETYEAVEWLDTVGIEFDTGKTDDVYGANLTYSVNGSDFVSANVAYEDGALYLTLPEINDEAICVDLLSLFIKGQGDYHRAEGLMDSFEEIMEVVPSDKVLENIIVKYLTAVAKGVKTVDEEKTNIEAGGVNMSAVSMTVTVDNDLLADISESVLNELLEDKDIEKLIKDVCELSMVDRDGDDAYDAFTDSIEKALDDIDDINAVDEEFDISFIADNRGQLVGMSAEIDGTELEFSLAKDGSNYGQLLSVTPSRGASVKIEGDGVLSGGKYSGEIALNAGGMDIIKVTLEDVDKGLWADGIFNGKMTITPTNAVSTLIAGMADNNIVSFVSGLKAEIVSSSTKKGGDVTFGVYTGEDLIVAVNGTYKASSDADYEIPGDYTEVTNEGDMENWVQNSQGSLLNLMGKLTSLGFPSHLIMGNN